MKKKTSAASKVILTLTLLFFYLPILYIIVFSFNDSRSLTKLSLIHISEPTRPY